MSGFHIAILTAFVVLTLASDIIWSPKLMARTRARVAAGDTEARTVLFRTIITSAWPAAVVAIVILTTAGLSFDAIGFNGGLNLGEVIPYTIAVPAGLVISTILIRRRGVEPRVTGDIEVLIPRTKTEQRWYAAVAVTAGITEEITYRALPILWLLAVLPDENKVLAGLISSLTFGLAHFYQGIGGMIATAFMGGLFAALYLYSGSLWPSIVTHVLIDIRLLFLYPLKKQGELITSRP